MNTKAVKASLIFLGVLVVVVLGVALFLNNRILPNTHLAGQNLGLMSREDAAKKVGEILALTGKTYLTVELKTGRGVVTKNVLFADFGVKYDHQKTLDELVSRRLLGWRAPDVWPKLLAIFSSYDLKARYSLDNQSFGRQVDDLLAGVNTPARDAQLIIMPEGPKIVSEQSGFGISGEQLTGALLERIESLDTSPLVLSGKALKPSVLRGDLEPLIKQADLVMSEPLKVTAAGKDFSFNKEKLSSWLLYDAMTHRLTLNEQNVRAAIGDIAKAVDKKGIPKKIIKNTDLVIQQGTDGLALDQDEVLAAIEQALLLSPPQHALSFNLKTQVAEVKRVTSPAAPSSNRGKIIKVVLSEQKLYAWQDGKLVDSFLISSGLVGPTPVGNWKIYNKTALQDYRAPDYYLPNVHWSSWFAPDISIHEAYWHNNFGQPMSHGCVNATLADSKFIFDWAPVGTPVEVVY